MVQYSIAELSLAECHSIKGVPESLGSSYSEKTLKLQMHFEKLGIPLAQGFWRTVYKFSPSHSPPADAGTCSPSRFKRTQLKKQK